MPGHVQVIQSFFSHKFISFSGRAGRREYFWFYVFIFNISNALNNALDAILEWVVPKILPNSEAYTALNVSLSTLLVAIPLAGICVMTFSWVSLNVRRFHDLGLSGWYSLAVCFIFAMALVTPKYSMPSILCVILFFVWFLSMLFWPGQKTANRFGPPLNQSPAA